MFDKKNMKHIKIDEKAIKAQKDTLIYNKTEIFVPKTLNANGHEYVDLGLPSGTLWATMNIGATKPEECGQYFAWGETNGYDNVSGGSSNHTFSWGTYKFRTDDNLTKYNGQDGKTVLDLEDDAAHVNWGGDWQMPTPEQVEELVRNTKKTSGTTNDVAGILFTGQNLCSGSTLFIPFAGYCSGTSVSDVGDGSYVWCSSLYEYNKYDAYGGYVNGNGYANCYDLNTRCDGLSVRPVLVQ